MEVIKEGGHLSLTADEATEATVRNILADIRRDGMEAIRGYSHRLDSWDPASFEISEEQINQASKQLPNSLRQDIDFCQKQVREFALKQMEALDGKKN